MANTAPKKKASPFKTIKDCIFVYTSTNRAQKQLNKENKPAPSGSPLEFHSWEIKILIPESRFKKGLREHFTGAKNFPNKKELSPKQAAEAYGVDWLADAKEDWILIKFSQSCLTGKAIPDGNGGTTRKASRPLKQFGIKGKVQDANGLTINDDTSLGNGTRGMLQFNPVENAHGLYLYPVALCITELVEYEGAGGCDEDAFGFEELDESEAGDEFGDSDEFGSDDEISDDAVDTSVPDREEPSDSAALEEEF